MCEGELRFGLRRRLLRGRIADRVGLIWARRTRQIIIDFLKHSIIRLRRNLTTTVEVPSLALPDTQPHIYGAQVGLRLDWF